MCPENVFGLNFTRILGFFWDQGHIILSIPKDAVFAEILVFGNIFGFLTVNWTSIWTETVNFNCIPFESKFKILQDFLNTVFLIGDYLWSKFQEDETIFGRVRAQMDAESIQK